MSTITPANAAGHEPKALACPHPPRPPRDNPNDSTTGEAVSRIPGKHQSPSGMPGQSATRQTLTRY